MEANNNDALVIGGVSLTSRLLTGTGKYGSDTIIPDVCASSGSQVITVALRRVDTNAATGNVMQHIPKHMQLLPNTSGARNADEARPDVATGLKLKLSPTINIYCRMDTKPQRQQKFLQKKVLLFCRM
jgi:thiazole synthase ThiGH ThiG subunit